MNIVRSTHYTKMSVLAMVASKKSVECDKRDHLFAEYNGITERP